MVRLTRIYTKTGDSGETSLGDGTRVAKCDPRVEAYGAVDETNAAIGAARAALADGDPLDDSLSRIQNDLFDLGADLCTPDRGEDLGYEPLRMTPEQTVWLERQIDALNGALSPLESFVLPAGGAAAAQLHVARTIARRAERLTVALARTPGEVVSAAALTYINRLSDYLFVASRKLNADAGGDVLWVPGANRTDPGETGA